jgi:hypothetical protein
MHKQTEVEQLSIAANKLLHITVVWARSNLLMYLGLVTGSFLFIFSTSSYDASRTSGTAFAEADASAKSSSVARVNASLGSPMINRE